MPKSPCPRRRRSRRTDAARRPRRGLAPGRDAHRPRETRAAKAGGRHCRGPRIEDTRPAMHAVIPAVVNNNPLWAGARPQRRVTAPRPLRGPGGRHRGRRQGKRRQGAAGITGSGRLFWNFYNSFGDRRFSPTRRPTRSSCSPDGMHFQPESASIWLEPIVHHIASAASFRPPAASVHQSRTLERNPRPRI